MQFALDVSVEQNAVVKLSENVSVEHQNGKTAATVSPIQSVSQRIQHAVHYVALLMPF